MQVPDMDVYPSPESVEVAPEETAASLLANYDLTDEERSVTLWRLSTDLSFKEIGRKLGIPQGTVPKRYNDAIRKIKDQESK